MPVSSGFGGSKGTGKNKRDGLKTKAKDHGGSKKGSHWMEWGKKPREDEWGGEWCCQNFNEQGQTWSWKDDGMARSGRGAGSQTRCGSHKEKAFYKKVLKEFQQSGGALTEENTKVLRLAAMGKSRFERLQKRQEKHIEERRREEEKAIQAAQEALETKVISIYFNN